MARVPGPVQQRCAEALIAGATLASPATALTPVAVGAPSAPVTRLAPPEPAGPHLCGRGAVRRRRPRPRRIRAAAAIVAARLETNCACVAVARPARMACREGNEPYGAARQMPCAARVRAAMMRPARGLLPMNRRVFCQSLGVDRGNARCRRTAGRRRSDAARPPGAECSGWKAAEMAWLNDLSAVEQRALARLAHIGRQAITKGHRSALQSHRPA